MASDTDRLPSLTSGHGMPARQITLCDGRTSLRMRDDPEGFGLLVHYAADSFYSMSKVLVADRPMTWSVDGEPHRFDWMEVFPFGYVNREERREGLVESRVTLVQGGVVWVLGGVRTEAVFRIPCEMFVETGQYDNDIPVDVRVWTLGGPAADGSSWSAVRKEQWLFRDSSTYAGIAGKRVPSERRASELHLCFKGWPSLRVDTGGEHIAFSVAPDASGEVRLALGMGSHASEARGLAEKLAANPRDFEDRQRARYLAIARSTPELHFGRHTAMKRFFRLQPLYLESMRIAEEPGAYRANNDYYWVWGWDMTRPAFGMLTGNRGDFVKALLDFRNDHRNANGSVIDQYDNTLRRDLRWMDGPSILEYLLAHDYLAWTGDLEGTRRWQGWFRQTLERGFEMADPATGLLSGAAASTDFPEEFGRTFPAWMSYTTGWQYGAYLGAEKLFLAWGDAAFAARIREEAAKIRRNFGRVFWNPVTGFWNEGVSPTNPDLVCDIPLSTALAAMDSPYGEDLYAGRLAACAAYADLHFLRDDGVFITARGEVRGWKEWTRQGRNWFAANDTMLARLFRTVGNARALERLFYLYEINFGYQPCAFEGKPLHRPLNTSGSWQAFGAGAWYRNLVEAAAGLWADLGGLGLVPCGLGEPVKLSGLRFREAMVDFEAAGQGIWPKTLLVDGKPLTGTTKFPPVSAGSHSIRVEYGLGIPTAPVLTLAVDAEVHEPRVSGNALTVRLVGTGYTPITFFSPGRPEVELNGQPVPCEWEEDSGRGRARFMLEGPAQLSICSAG